ncbi:MAG: MFS transporter [Muribaculaceae bacterium]|nr:MFS transporter [Muribaculaceae bacterium]
MHHNGNGIKNLIHRYIAIGAVLIVLAMTMLDGTVVNVALPILAKEFNVSDSSAVWIVTVYQLVITMLLLPVSSLGDIYSYRRNYIIGIVVFTAGSALCALSGSFGMIIGARAVQAIGAAMVMAVNVALVRLIYPPEYLGRGLAVNTMVIAIASAAGPSLAGAILSVASWHWLFIINIPFGILAFLMAYKYLPQNPPRDHRVKFDWISGIANIIVFGAIFYALGNFARGGDTMTNVLLLCCGVVVGIFYIRHLHGHEQPMFPIDLLHSRLYTLSILTYTGSFVAQNIAMIALPFLFLNGFGFSELTTGLLMTPWPLATMIVSPFAARFIEKHNAGATAAFGMLVYALGLVLLLTAPARGSVTELDIAWRMAICGAGFGIFQTPNSTVMIQATPISRSGAAGGFQSTARIGGQTFGATTVTLVFALLSRPTDAGSLNNGAPGVHEALYIALAFAVIAGLLSLSRFKSISHHPSTITTK